MVKHYLVSGQVQGVGYRMFIEKRARQVGVSGRVRNLKDGRVEIVASGQDSDVLQLEVYIKRGPESGEVSSVEEFVVKTEMNLPPKFTVTPDGEVPWSYEYA